MSSSNAASGTSAITASSTPSSVPACTAATPTTSAPHIASPDSSVAAALADPAVRALAAASAVSRASIAAVRRELGIQRAEGGQLGAALEQVDDGGGQLAANGTACSRLGARVPAAP